MALHIPRDPLNVHSGLQNVGLPRCELYTYHLLTDDLASTPPSLVDASIQSNPIQLGFNVHIQNKLL